MSTPRSKRSKVYRPGIALLSLLTTAVILARLSMAAVGWWIDFGEEPVKSDIMVVLAGSYSRPPYAADLYAQNYAPVIWIGHPKQSSIEAKLSRFGYILPPEDAVDKDILLKKGVPKDRIRVYGDGTTSTVDEALSLKREFPPQGKKILVVTSRYHARRVRMIFRHFLPGAEIHVVSTPYEDFTRDWWKDKALAQLTVLEVFKTAYYLLGGAFVSNPK